LSFHTCRGAALAAEKGTLPDWRIFMLLVMASLLLRYAGIVVNDLWDKDFDGKASASEISVLTCGYMIQSMSLCEPQIFVCFKICRTESFRILFLWLNNIMPASNNSNNIVTKGRGP